MENKPEILVEVKNVSKKFSRNLRKSLVYGLRDVFLAFVGLGKSNRSKLRSDEFWAVKNVSFSLRRGEVLGLIGHNGAGKSTLLKMLNGLIRPDEGTITMRGRIGALIELGTGFNPVLTGRENIYINGQILGFKKKEIDGKLQAIIDFSEIGAFIDSPVQTYSSGMKVRLGFAVASQMEPDVLILDEVLAVGDIGFQGKCLKVISGMMNRAAVIFVSHSMPIVNRYCNRGLLLSKGQVVKDSVNVQEAIDDYLGAFSNADVGNTFDSGQVSIEKFEISSVDLITKTARIPVFEDAEIHLEFGVNDPTLSTIRFRLNFLNKNLLILASIISDELKVVNGKTSVTLTAGPFNFQPDAYKISLIVFGRSFTDPLVIHDSRYNLDVTGNKDYGGNFVILKTRKTG